MSGHGGGGGGGGASDGTTDCASLIFTTTLNSPVPNVISTLGADDVLQVSRSAPTERRIVAVTSAGEIAGSITHGRQADLLKCLEEGTEYVGIVIRVSGGACDIQVRPKAG
jgi:hypothetical protein